MIRSSDGNVYLNSFVRLGSGIAANLLRAFSWGYGFDGMAKDEIVKFANILLADHKEIISEPANAINLGGILALFVEAGWLEAAQLLMRLESAVR